MSRFSPQQVLRMRNQLILFQPEFVETMIENAATGSSSQVINGSTATTETTAVNTCIDLQFADGSPWHDIDGVDYDCPFYGTDGNCIKYGHDYGSPLTANEACCVCGGGVVENETTNTHTQLSGLCESGFVQGMPCNNMDLLSFYSYSELTFFERLCTGCVPSSSKLVNDVWGWTNPKNGQQLVVAGTGHSSVILDVTDGNQSRYLGYISQGPSDAGLSLWKDVKIHSNGFAYIVSEAASFGLQVFDLHKLEEKNQPEAYTATMTVSCP